MVLVKDESELAVSRFPDGDPVPLLPKLLPRVGDALPVPPVDAILGGRSGAWPSSVLDRRWFASLPLDCLAGA